MMSVQPGTQTATAIEPTPYQDQFLRGDKRYLGFISGVGAGKTYAGIARTILNMEEWNPGEMGAIVAPTRQMVVNVIIPEMRELGILDRYEYKSSYADEPGIHAPNGSRALILSADNQKTIERLRGLNLAWGWIDEEAVVDPRAREILMQRLRTGRYRNLFITTTPKGKNHTYDFFVKPATTNTAFQRATLYETDDKLAITGVPTDANPNLPDDYQDAMASDLPDEIRAQEVQGQFVEIGAGIFERDMIHFCEPEDIHDDWQLNYLLGVDPAVQADSSGAQQSDSDYWAATLCAVHRRKNQLYAVDTARERGMTLKEGTQWVASIANQVPNPTLAVESNQSQRWLRQELADMGFSTINVQSQRNKEERLIDLSIPLENGVIEFVNHETDQQLGYDPRWQQLIEELLAFPEGAHDDLIDSLHLCVDNAQLNASNVFGADPYGRGDE